MTTGPGMASSSDPRSIADAAERLMEAARTRTAIAPIKSLLADGDVGGAYAVQRRVTDSAIAEGRRIVGRKIGLTSVAIQRQLGIASPDFGALFADMAFASGAPIPWSRLLQPKVEAEVAIVLERGLESEHLELADVAAATAYALPAIEVVGSRIADWKISIVDTIADNASSGVYVLGETRRKLDAFDARLCGMVMTLRGEDVSLGVGAACLGHPLNAALWLARTMVAVGTPLREGDIVLTGALGPMVTVAPGDEFKAEIGGLGSVVASFAAEDAG